MINKIISGAQNGADIAGLKVAKLFGLESGGWIPKGFRTLDGPKPEYSEIFGIQEHSSFNYPPRTFLNVKYSDGTMRFAADFNSSGEICTLKAIFQYKKPYFDVNVLNPEDHAIEKATEWIIENKINILNVAGNSQKTYCKTEKRTIYFLTMLLRNLGLKEK